MHLKAITGFESYLLQFSCTLLHVLILYEGYLFLTIYRFTMNQPWFAKTGPLLTFLLSPVFFLNINWNTCGRSHPSRSLVTLGPSLARHHPALPEGAVVLQGKLANLTSAVARRATPPAQSCVASFQVARLKAYTSRKTICALHLSHMPS